MASPAIPLLLLLLRLAAEATVPPCTSRTFSKSRTFAACQDLPALGASLHYTYNKTTGSLSLAFSATPPAAGGWVTWGINPDEPKMTGTQAVGGYVLKDGSAAADTYNVSSYSALQKSAISYKVAGLEAEAGKGNEVTVFATMKLAAGTAKVLHVWQVGPPVSGGVLGKHTMSPDNLNAMGELDLVAGKSKPDAGTAARLQNRNIHGVLNAVSWGVLLPVGAMIARYLQLFKSTGPAWFYLHVACQVSGYAVGIAGWGTGLKLGSESEGMQYNTHRSIGIAMFCLGTVQMLALLLRPKKDHKYRPYWRAYHLAAGYVVIILGVVNIFKGLDTLSPDHRWKTAYIAVIAVLGGLAVLLEAFTWFMVLRGNPNTTTTSPRGHQHKQEESSNA